MNQKKKHYSEELWEAIRIVWENSSSLTNPEVIVLVQELTGVEDLPDKSVIARKAKEKKWVRRNAHLTPQKLAKEINNVWQDLRQKEDDLIKNVQKLKKDGTKTRLKKSSSQQSSQEMSQEESQVIENDDISSRRSSETMQVNEDFLFHSIGAKSSVLTKEKVIEHQRNSIQMLVINDMMVDSFYKRVLQMSSWLFEDRKQEEDDEDKLLGLKLQVGAIKDLAYINNVLWQNHAMANESAKRNWGIELEDVSDRLAQNQVIEAEINELELQASREKAERGTAQGLKEALMKKIELQKEEQKLLEHGSFESE